MRKISNKYERYLNYERDKFCKYRCKKNELNIAIVHEAVESTECDSCGKEVDVTAVRFEVDICNYCPVPEYIRELVNTREIQNARNNANGQKKSE